MTDKVLRRIRALSVAVILGGVWVMGGEPAEVEGATGCFMCINQCPADVQEYCRDMGCVGNGICYSQGTECYDFAISCDLI